MPIPKYYLIDYKHSEFELHDTIESVQKALNGSEGEDCESQFTATDSLGNVKEISMEEVNDSIKKMGIFGFAEEDTRKVHLWADANIIYLQDLIYFLGHELGHLTPPPKAEDCNLEDPEEAHYYEEQRAEWYAGVAHEAYTMAEEIWSKL